MEATNALIFALGIYALAFGVAMFVVVTIIVIRWATADRVKPAVASVKEAAKREEGIA